jgi:hypothetical protein
LASGKLLMAWLSLQGIRPGERPSRCIGGF